jgi:HEPN domain-containing protein
MEDSIKNTDQIILHWRKSAEKDYTTMQNLLKSGDNSWALFLGHLVIEKLLKALYAKKLKEHAIFSHDLLRLAKKIEIDIPEEYIEWLDEITTFNLNARYDDMKQSFYSICTKDFTQKWVGKIDILREWLMNQL